MMFDFECIMKYGKHISISCALLIKSDHPDTLEFKLEYHSCEDVVTCFIDRVGYYK